MNWIKYALMEIFTLFIGAFWIMLLIGVVHANLWSGLRPVGYGVCVIINFLVACVLDESWARAYYWVLAKIGD